MIHRKNILLILSSGGMMLCWFYGWTSFVFASLSHKMIPLLETAVILFLATIITYIHNRKSWRWIYIIGLHLSGILYSSFWLYHRYYKLESFFWDLNWITDFFLLERTLSDWITFVLLPLCGWIVWFCGTRLWTKPTEQTTIRSRFDWGLTFFLSLLLVKLVIEMKGGSIPMDHSIKEPLFSFMILGLFSLGFVRTRSTSQQENVTYLKGVGIILSFTFVILMLGGGLFILFLPQLQSFAEAGIELPATMKSAMLQVLVPFMRMITKMASRQSTSQIQERTHFSTNNVSTNDGSDPINGPVADPGIFFYLFAGVIVVILLAIAGFIILRLLKWIFSRTVLEVDQKKGIWELLLSYIYTVKAFFLSLSIKIIKRPDTASAAEKYFNFLLRWGRISGLKHTASETPKEYGSRLGDRFPKIEKEIGLIVHIHDEAIYGCIPVDQSRISSARLALRKIRSPLLWFARIKFLCFQNRS